MNWICSEPSHGNDPVEGLQPIQKDHVHFINFDNAGLKSDLNPHKETIAFWTQIEQQASKFNTQIENQQRDEL